MSFLLMRALLPRREASEKTRGLQEQLPKESRGFGTATSGYWTVRRLVSGRKPAREELHILGCVHILGLALS